MVSGATDGVFDPDTPLVCILHKQVNIDNCERLITLFCDPNNVTDYNKYSCVTLYLVTRSATDDTYYNNATEKYNNK